VWRRSGQHLGASATQVVRPSALIIGRFPVRIRASALTREPVSIGMNGSELILKD
jgi:hypothetical protein